MQKHLQQLTLTNTTTMLHQKINQPKLIRKYGMLQKPKLALRAILKAKGAKGFTTNFDDLGQTDGSYFDQIPGLASQRLMAEGYGFGAEGDWKTAAMVRLMKVMTAGKEDAKGTSFNGRL